jgi:hypothetical protein
MKKITKLSIFFAPFLISNQAFSQEIEKPVVEQAISENEYCDIELFVAKKYGVTTASGGGLLGALIVGALSEKGDKSATTDLMDALPPEKIRAIVIQTNLTSAVGKSVVRVNYNVLEDDYKANNKMIKLKTRSTQNSNQCYYELFIPGIDIIRGAFNINNTMATPLYFKYFSGQNSTKTVKGTIRKGVGGFPAKDGIDKTEATQKVVTQFTESINYFFTKKVN